VTVKAKTPPKGVDSFYVYDTLYVPMESVALYKATSPWKQFKHIIGVNNSSGQNSGQGVPRSEVHSINTNGDSIIQYLNLEYEILDIKKHSLCVKGCSDSISEDLKIPTTVTHKGISYSVTNIGAEAFLNCNELTNITIPNSVTNIGNGAFFGCCGLTNAAIPNSVTHIGRNAFFSCIKLTSVIIPNSVTNIGNGAFGCSGLKSLTIGESVTKIGEEAFKDCSGLTRVTIPNSVSNIGAFAFSGCSGLTDVTIPNSVYNIGEGAFEGCSSLTSVTIPNAVTKIGWDAFKDCNKLTRVTMKTATPSHYQYTIFSVYDTLYVPNESVDLYQNTSPWNQFKHIIGVDSSGKPISHIETNSQASSTKSPNEVKKQIKENSGSSSSSKKSFFDRLRGLWHTTRKDSL
jgi:hypothetical protein